MEELTLHDLMDIFTQNIKVIILTIMLFGVLGIIYTQILVEPLYSSSTKIILVDSLKKPEVNNSNNLAADVTLNQKLVSTYSEIIKSNKVIDLVIKNLKLSDSAQQIASSITVAPVKNSEVINISVENKSPKVAAYIANELVKVFSVEVKKIYGIENVNQLDIATPNNEPINVKYVLNISIFCFIGFMISYGINFLIKITKTTVQTEEEIIKLTGKYIIAIIPQLEKGVM